MIKDIGEIGIDECDEANIPVNCFLHEPEHPEKQFEWTADNFMPRKSYTTESAYHIKSDTREEIIDAVNKHVAPLYEIALNKLKTTGENYYWELIGGTR